MDAANSVVQFFASNAVLIFGVGALSILSLYLTLTVARQRKQLAVLKAPPRRRYGFLGKPLYAAAVVALFVGGFGLTYYAGHNTQPVTVSADSQVDLTLNVQVIATTVEGSQVGFSVIPAVDTTAWGGANGPDFDAFWTAVGPSGFSQVELGLNSSNVGGFTKVLRSGAYQITVDVLVNGRRFNKTISLTI